MTFKCSECGQHHDELARYFMCRAPQDADGNLLKPVDDHKSMCRADGRYFVRCEIELPLRTSDSDPLGYIFWVEVIQEDYDQLLDYRRNEIARADYSELVPGKVANWLRAIPNTFGTAVSVAVVPGDPTPYVKWVAPDSTLAALVASGVSLSLWHELAEIH